MTIDPSDRTAADPAPDRAFMLRAIELSRLCPPAEHAFSVGAVVVGADGEVLSEGYSREGGDPVVHAEEAALAKLPAGDPRLRTATVYSSLEPCSRRASRPHPCADLLLAAGVARVVVAWREPDLFVTGCEGIDRLRAAGVEVVELPELAATAREVNRHLFVS